MPGSLTIARIFGIEIRVHSSWLFVFFLVLFTFRSIFLAEHPLWTDEQRWIAAGATTLLFFLSVLLHELSHSVVARRFRLPVHSITLFIFGGVANLRREPESARSEFLMAAVGPGMSFLLGGVAWVLWHLAEFALTGRTRQVSAGVFEQIAVINVVLGAFNLLPGFPLDGGRLLRSVLWGWRKDRRIATRIATRGGQVVAAGLAVWGLAQLLEAATGDRDQFISGGWSLLIAFFLFNAASASYRQELFDQSLRDVNVGTLMTRDPTPVPPDLPVAALVATYVLPMRGRAFPVERDGRLLGVVSVGDVRRLPQREWSRRVVSDVMTPVERAAPLSPSDDAQRGLERLMRVDATTLPVVADGQTVGLFERDVIFEYLRMRQELGLQRR